MCGIAGFVGHGDAADLARMSAVLRHRGPDSQGTWSHPECGVHFAVRRLAILDREHAGQPMVGPDGTLVVAFNGEIYNHAELRAELERAGASFRTGGSDTEVLLHAYREWGPALTARLNGMWAFAIYDAHRHSLFLSRDRFGQKPLYYAVRHRTFVFASELTSLLEHNAVDASVSSTSVQKYFAYGFIPAPRSLYRDVFKLPAGCNLTVDTRTLASHLTRYWDYTLPESADPQPRAVSEAQLAEELRLLLRNAVRRQLHADVPVGVFLSGGLDSSAITYFATKECSTPVKTFSIGFAEPTFDESRQASRMSALLGTDHTARRLSTADAAGVMDRVASSLDEPIADSSIVCTHLLCETARRQVTVALGGEGADELFGGYDPFRALRLAQWYSRLVPKPVHRAVGLIAARLPSRTTYMPFDYRVTRALRGLSYPPALWNPVWIGPLDPAEIAACVDDADSLESVYSEAIALWDAVPRAGLIEKTMQFYTKLYFQDGILPKVDRAGMMNSLEVRSPFLDLDLVEFVSRLPTHLKFRRGRTKYLFKEAMRPFLPADVVNQRKHGFAVPMASWLRGNWMAPAVPTWPRAPRRDFIERKRAAHQAGRENNALFLWSVWLLAQVANGRVRP